MKKIAIIIPYFGKWPDWIDLFFFSCAKNPTIDFMIFTDCEIKDIIQENIKLFPISFSEYSKYVSEQLNITFSPNNPYKLCDLKPFYGYLHRDLLIGYDFYGFGDVDLVYGDLRAFITDDILDRFGVISTHDDRISGHFCLFKNNDENINKVFKVKEWKNKLEAEKMVTITENFLTRLYFPIFNFNIFVKKILWRFIGREMVIKINNKVNRVYKKTTLYFKKKLFFKEQYTTPLSYIYWIDDTLHDAQPDTWFYKDGNVTNDRDKFKKFIYIHFMNFKNGKYRKDKMDLWPKKFYNVKKNRITDGVCINKQGIFSIDNLQS